MKAKLLLILAIFSLSYPIKADHLTGGEIYWECLANGKFVFHMNIYGECSVVTNFSFNNKTLNVIGVSLPKDALNGNITQITLKPDSNKWLSQNMGDITPQCYGSGGSSISCANRDVGAVQVFTFASDPIQLRGVPPSSGWVFHYSEFNRAVLINRSSSGGAALGLRAIMYPILNSSGSSYLSTNVCNDNSPQFGAAPQTLFCRGQVIDYSSQVIDIESDSLVYEFDHAVTNTPLNFLAFGLPYTYNNPLPDTSFDVRNRSIQLSKKTGQMNFAVFNGMGISPYMVIVRIEAYRQGQKIASVYRDFPIQIIDCNLLPTGVINKPPAIIINGNNSSFYQVSVPVGTNIQYQIQVSDSDLDLSRNPPFQLVSLSMVSEMFSSNLTNSTFCPNSPCATISPAPSLNSNGLYEITGPAGVSGMFNWQPDSSHLGKNYSPKSYFFTLRASDDHCPLPSISYATIEIIVTGNTVGLDEKSLENGEYSIYPNPTNGLVKLVGEATSIKKVRLKSITGQLIQEFMLQNEFEIKGNPGIYFLEIENENGKSFQKKIMKY
jgi:hypothetical protein